VEQLRLARFDLCSVMRMVRSQLDPPTLRCNRIVSCLITSAREQPGDRDVLVERLPVQATRTQLNALSVC